MLCNGVISCKSVTEVPAISIVRVQINRGKSYATWLNVEQWFEIKAVVDNWGNQCNVDGIRSYTASCISYDN